MPYVFVFPECAHLAREFASFSELTKTYGTPMGTVYYIGSSGEQAALLVI